MATVRVKLDPIEKDINLILRDTMGAPARKTLVQNFARGELAKAQAINANAMGVVPPHETIVDGRRHSDLAQINPDRGLIVFEFELLIEVVDWCWAQLFKYSPVLTGRYSKSHLIFADGRELDTPDPSVLAAQWTIASGVPYARKIEKGLSDQAPDGVYEGVAALARTRFGNFAKVRFTFVPVQGTATMLHQWASGTRLGLQIRNPVKRSEWLRRQPALVITLR